MTLSCQIRAARALLGISQPELARLAGVSTTTLKRVEGSAAIKAADKSHIAVRKALEEAGVEFIEENGGGPGVRLRNAISEAKPEAAGRDPD